MEKSLREAPKKTERLEYAANTKSGRRVAKKHDNRTGKRSGFRVTYYDCDED